MYTVTSVFKSEYRVKGSKFLGYLFPSSDDTETEKHLQAIKKEHSAATHHCYAFLLNPHEPVEFSTDDGEPGGTAGLPILNILKSHELMNVVLIVVRYYGGTKLGKSGLIDAYKTTARQTVECATIKKLIPIKTYRLKYHYSQQSIIDQLKNDFNLIEMESFYLEVVELILGCPKEEVGQFEGYVSSREHQLISFKPVDKSFHVEQ